MKFILQPWQLMLIILASWVNRQQPEVMEQLRTENAVLKEKFGRKLGNHSLPEPKPLGNTSLFGAFSQLVVAVLDSNL